MKTTRIDKYKSFQDFFDGARERFRKIADADPRNEAFERMHSLRIIPGGWNGGKDKCVVEIFYGQRPFDEALRPAKANPTIFSSLYRTLLTEHGAVLRYQRMDSGIVIVELHPAGTENWKQVEDLIFLDWVPNPSSLLNKRILKRHWRALMSYMQCTSLDGEPTFLDKLRIAYLRFFRKRIVSGKDGGILAYKVGGVIITFILTVGLSGFLVNWWNSSSDNTRPQPSASVVNIGALQLREKDTQINPKSVSPTSSIAQLPADGNGAAENGSLPIERRISIAAIIEAAATTFLAVISAILAWFTYKLWKSTRRLAISTRTLTLDAEDTSKRQLRAYIGVDENPDHNGRDLIYDKASKRVRAIASALNFGQTPAYNVYYFGQVEYLPHPLPANFEFPEIKYEKRTVLHPGKPYFLDIASKKNKPYTKAKFDSRGIDARHANHRWYVYGFVSYQDTFGERHWTKFCFWLSWHGKGGTASSPGWYTNENGFNNTDDQFSEK